MLLCSGVHVICVDRKTLVNKYNWKNVWILLILLCDFTGAEVPLLYKGAIVNAIQYTQVWKGLSREEKKA